MDPRRRPAPFIPPPLRDLVVYELHIGTFSPEGTFAGAIPYLAELAALGVRAIEIMPVAEFPGARGWGYDGVYLSAAQSSYGGPDGLAALVAAAHEAGLAVILDVVYNHVGASGVTALEAFGPYFTERYETPWGRAINYDDADCDPVREWVLQSATGWIRDFGIDGLRLDAIHAIFDSSPEHIVAAVARRVHGVRAAALVIAESGMNDPRVMRPPSVVAGAATPPGRTTSTTLCARSSPTSATATTTSSATSPISPRRCTVRTFTTASTRHSAGGGSALRPRTCHRSASSSSIRTTTRSATGRSATGCRRRRVRSRP